MERRITFQVTRFMPISYDRRRYKRGDKIQMWREEALRMQEMGWGVIVELTHKNRITK